MLHWNSERNKHRELKINLKREERELPVSTQKQETENYTDDETSNCKWDCEMKARYATKSLMTK